MTARQPDTGDDLGAALGDAARGLPVLYHDAFSLGSQVARLVLAEKGVRWQGRSIDTGPRHEELQPWYVRLNRGATVPTLVHDGRVIGDPVGIARYVDAGFDGPPLVPAAPSAKAEMERWIAAQGAVPSAVLTYGRLAGLPGALARHDRGRRIRLLAARRRRHPDLADAYDARLVRLDAVRRASEDPDVLAWAHDDMAMQLDAAERHLAGGRGCLVGARFTLADAVWTVLLARLHLLGLQAELAKRPALAAYDARMRGRPAAVAAGLRTRPDWATPLRVSLGAYARQLLRPATALSSIGLWLMIRAG
jgi:tetrachloro-p-hydroquinone reductive dehalogenase